MSRTNNIEISNKVFVFNFDRENYCSAYLEVETFDGLPELPFLDVELRRLAIENRLLREEIARLK